MTSLSFLKLPYTDALCTDRRDMQTTFALGSLALIAQTFCYLLGCNAFFYLNTAELDLDLRIMWGVVIKQRVLILSVMGLRLELTGLSTGIDD